LFKIREVENCNNENKVAYFKNFNPPEAVKGLIPRRLWRYNAFVDTPLLYGGVVPLASDLEIEKNRHFRTASTDHDQKHISMHFLATKAWRLDLLSLFCKIGIKGRVIGNV
jgi:hypothetical protein